MKKRIKFQVLKVELDANNSKSFSFETDKTYSKITGIFMMNGNYAYASQESVEFTKPLRIGNEEIFPEGMESILLYPRAENSTFTECELPAAGTLFNGAFAASSAGTQKIILRLENE